VSPFQSRFTFACKLLTVVPTLQVLPEGEPVVDTDTGSAVRPSVMEVTVSCWVCSQRHLYVRQHILRIDEGSSSV
jgi:hypothetical protein